MSTFNMSLGCIREVSSSKSLDVRMTKVLSECRLLMLKQLANCYSLQMLGSMWHHALDVFTHHLHLRHHPLVSPIWVPYA